MRAKSISDFRKNIAADIDAAVEDHVPLIITRTGGKQPAIVMALEDFEAWKETIHLSSTKANALRLAHGNEDFEAKRGIEAPWPK